MDARREVGRGTALLVHHADLDRVAREPEQILDRVEQAIGERGFVRPMHLGLDDIDRPRAAVGQAVGALEVVERDQRSEEHTSALQSLMRISYAVFCLKKKK